MSSRPAARRTWLPTGWDSEMSDEYEWAPLRLPPEVTRVSASTRLSIEAEYRGWELARVRLYTDGSRRVLYQRSADPGVAGHHRGGVGQTGRTGGVQPR
ncbi:DUF5703 family protein [Mycobacterium tuberculosis]|uniref:DUF5703 family protein n=1 Tax=Mycobacterium tuberculosis TaxID=1773 RepID=UPI00272A919C|nr:DUF5703 family protein [Mycobacterium tuberculosis]